MVGEMASSSDTLQLTIQTPRHYYARGESILLTGTLTNIGATPQLVNGMFVLMGATAEKTGFGIAVRILTPTGQTLKYGMLYEMAGPSKDWFVTLESGAGFTREIHDMSSFLNQSNETGTYHLTAVYYNYIGRGFGLDPWIGQVCSNTLAIDIHE